MMSFAAAPAVRPIPWWFSLVSGIAAIVIGFLLLAAPGQMMVVLVQLLGLYWLVAGLLAIATIFVDSTKWGWKLVLGVLGILAGLAVIQHPLWAALAVPTFLVLFLAIDGIVLGGIALGMAFFGGGWAAAVLGVLSIGFGIVLLGAPLMAAAALPMALGIWGIVAGAATVFAAFKERPTAARPAPGAAREAA